MTHHFLFYQGVISIKLPRSLSWIQIWF